MIIQGDCLELLKGIESKSFDLLIIDPPYNVGIDEWDKIPNYIEWLSSRFTEFERVLKDNGTMWLFHISFPTLGEIHKALERNTGFKFKQFITINKGLQSIAGRASENLRSYPRATEYLLFYTFQDLTGAEQLNEQYQRINPMAKYLKEEFRRAGVTQREISTLFPSKTGGLTGCVANWTLGYNFPLKEQYEKIRNHLNGEYLKREYEYLKREYEDLKREYEDLRREYEEMRYTFNMEHGITDVWDIDFYKDRVPWHPTSKPYDLIKRIIETSTNENDVVLDPFSGSGTTALVCRDLKRQYTCIELNEEYVIKSKQRLRETPIKLTNYDSCD